MRVTLHSPTRSGARLLALAAAATLLPLTAVVAGADWAAAQGRMCPGPDNTLVYCNDIPGDTDPDEHGNGGSGGGGNGEPPCDLDLARARTSDSDRHEHFCEGSNACWRNDPPIGFEDESTWPEPPSEDAGRYIYKECISPEKEIVFQDFTWTGVTEEPSLEEQARTAYGRLEAPAFSLAFSPPRKAVIFIDTWWWADGAPADTIEGTSAFGLVAVGTPSSLEVDPGDGSGVLTCDFVTTEGDACSHTYERASHGGGYPARARLVYEVHFEENGAPVEIAGMPATFESAWEETSVPVTEVQANVVR